MRPRVEAQRMLDLAEAHAAGSGHLRNPDSWFAELRRLAGFDQPQPPRPRDRAAARTGLRGLINLRRS
jgi:hypothetical protein